MAIDYYYLSANMGLVIPTPTLSPGPNWAQDLNASLTFIDAHDHSAGKGVLVTPSGMNINGDLTFNTVNNAIGLRSVRLYPQLVPITGSTPDLGCIYVSGADLYYNDGNGNQVRITSSGSVAGSAGTITGLPSGTAGAAYVAGTGTFVFTQSTSTAANMDVGSIVVRYPGSYPTPSGNYILLQAPSTLSTGYSITLPSRPLANNTFMTMDTAGTIGTTVVVDASTIVIASNILKVPTDGITALEIAPLTITAAEIANSTITGGKLAAATIAGSNVAAGTIAQSNLVVKATGSSVALGNVAVGGGSGANYTTTSSSFTSIPNATLTIVTHGSPVIIKFFGASTSTGNQAFLSLAVTSGAVVGTLALTRNGAVIQPTAFSTSSGSVSWGSSIEMLDVVGAGTYTYAITFNVVGNGSFVVSNYSMAIYEL